MMDIKEAIRRAKRWAATARAMEKICKSGGYQFMARDNGNEADVLETLIEAIEGKEEKKHEDQLDCETEE